MQPINLVHKPKLAKIFIACYLIEPQYKAAFREMRCELDDDANRHYNRCSELGGKSRLHQTG